MGTASAAVATARAEIGVTESPSGSNKTKYGAWYGTNGVPWCDIFISWVGANSGNAKAIGKFAYTPSHAKWFQDQKRWGDKPVLGAIAFFDFPDAKDRIQHVGIVESWRSNGDVVTIEGNTSSGNRGSQDNGGGVYRRIRKPSVIVGYGYPAYDPEQKPEPKPMPKSGVTKTATVLYAKPSLTSRKVTTFKAGATVEILADHGTFWNVARGKGLTRRAGYVLKSLISV